MILHHVPFICRLFIAPPPQVSLTQGGKGQSSASPRSRGETSPGSFVTFIHLILTPNQHLADNPDLSLFPRGCGASSSLSCFLACHVSRLFAILGAGFSLAGPPRRRAVMPTRRKLISMLSQSASHRCVTRLQRAANLHNCPEHDYTSHRGRALQTLLFLFSGFPVVTFANCSAQTCAGERQ